MTEYEYDALSMALKILMEQEVERGEDCGVQDCQECKYNNQLRKAISLILQTLEGQQYMTDWMTEEDGIPHNNGKVRFYLIGADEDLYEYLGWFDMTDWDKGFQNVLNAAKNGRCRDCGDYQIMRHDQLMTLARNIQWVIEAVLDIEGEPDGSV